MKELCRISTASRNSESFKVVIEVSDGINKEVLVEPYKYDTSKEQSMFIYSGGITFDPRSLAINCSNSYAPDILLNIELCKFVMDTNPHLREG